LEFLRVHEIKIRENPQNPFAPEVPEALEGMLRCTAPEFIEGLSLRWIELALD
jgi:hypothetical protein